MTVIAATGLSAPRRTVIMRAGVMSAVFALLCVPAQCACAQGQPAGKREDLDVTMHIIVDPDAKLPDEVVRRIPLPARKPAERPPSGSHNTPAKPGAAAAGQERAREASEHGREASQAAQERARDAAEQREAARKAAAEERRRDRKSPDEPERPQTPPRH